MTNVSHTPGPWSQGRTLLTAQTKRWSKDQWDENERMERRTIFASFSAEDEGRSRIPVARISEQAHEWEANARLIAAAPDLLRELKHLVRLVEPALNGGTKIAGLATVNAVWEAIAKAEGTSLPA